jgi:hypothetical protein
MVKSAQYGWKLGWFVVFPNGCHCAGGKEVEIDDVEGDCIGYEIGNVWNGII